jgi:hypothetical protein
MSRNISKDVAALVDAAAPKPGRRGVYKKKNSNQSTTGS